MPASTIRSATSCTADGGRRDHADRDVVVRHERPAGRRRGGRVSRPIALPHLRRVDVDERGDAEPAFGEAPVVRQGVPEVPDAHDHDGPVLGEPELAPDLMDQVRDVVPDAARAVGAEVGQVLAHLRGVHARGLGEGLGRHRGGARLGDVDEGSQVDGQPSDRRLGDRADPSSCGAPARPASGAA